jgi:hypothetical protein
MEEIGSLHFDLLVHTIITYVVCAAGKTYDRCPVLGPQQSVAYEAIMPWLVQH